MLKVQDQDKQTFRPGLFAMKILNTNIIGKPWYGDTTAL